MAGRPSKPTQLLLVEKKSHRTKEEMAIRQAGEEALKTANVLSGGEKVRCMLSKMMFAKANLLLMDEPTNHLDLESIQALNQGMKDFPGTMLFTSHDHTFTHTIANRIIEIGPNGYMDKLCTYDEYVENEEFEAQRVKLYS